jgi:uncharacterized repeat protein (TIGR01451 family)
MKIQFNIKYLISASIIIILFAIKGKAQTVTKITEAEKDKPTRVTISVDNKDLNNSTSNISKPGNKSPREIVWVEYGDGQFTTSPETEHLFFQNSSSLCDFMIVKSTGIYAKGGRPPKQTVKQIPAKNKSTKLITGNSVFYNNEEDVRITPNVLDISAGDTMLYALSYRKPRNAANGLYKLIFFYNTNNTTIYEPIKVHGNYKVNDGYKNLMVPYIRTHHGEQLIKPNELPENIFNNYNQDFKQSGYLIFTVNINDDAERNIFLTMVPRANLPENANVKASLNLILIPPDNKIQKYNFNSRMLSNLASHDPNWEEVFPKCIVLPKKNQELKYQVHFQNTGLGPAKKVIVKTAIPSGLSAREIEVTNWSIGGVENNPNYHLNINRETKDSIVFEFVYDAKNTKIVLYGAVDLPDAPVNPKTMGDIYFRCNVHPGVPDVINSGTSIYFDDNEAVQTNDTKVEFKKCCDCEKDCNIKSNNKFVKWLLCKDC